MILYFVVFTVVIGIFAAIVMVSKRQSEDLSRRGYLMLYLVNVVSGFAVPLDQALHTGVIPPWLALAFMGISVVMVVSLLASVTSNWQGIVIDDIVTAGATFTLVNIAAMVWLTEPLSGESEIALVNTWAFATCTWILGRLIKQRVNSPRSHNAAQAVWMYTQLSGYFFFFFHTLDAPGPWGTLTTAIFAFSTSVFMVHIYFRLTAAKATASKHEGKLEPSRVNYFLAAAACLTAILLVAFETSFATPSLIVMMSSVLVLVVLRTLISISSCRELTEAAREKATYYHSLVEHSTDVVLISDATTFAVQYTSPNITGILQITPQEAQSLTEVLSVNPEYLQDVVTLCRNGRHMHPYVMEKDGRYYETTFSYANHCLVASTRDTTEAEQLRVDLHNLAYSDSLTGLANRAGITETIASYIEEHGDKTFVVFFDLDRFKSINDVHGHKAGDAVLRAVAERMQYTVREKCSFGRLGGDEFVMVTSGDEDSVRQAAMSVVEAIARPIQVLDHIFQIGASAGISSASLSRDPEQLIQYADTAMYDAKQHRGHVSVYDSWMTHASLVNVERDARMAVALRNDRYGIELTPVGLCREDQVVAYRATVGCQIDDDLVVGSAFEDFVVASRAQSFISVWTLEVAHQLGLDMEVALGIRLHKHDLARDDLVPQLVDAATRIGLPPGRITLEWSARDLQDDEGDSFSRLRDLKEAGFLLVLTDFGVGSSSLSVLFGVELAAVTLATELLTSLGEPVTDGLIEAVVTNCAMAGVTVFAEGVESREQLARLTDLGVSGYTGHFAGEQVFYSLSAVREVPA